MHICYILTFSKDGVNKVYIGRTSNFKQRLNRHLNELKKNLHHNTILQKLYNEGWVYNEKPKIFVQLSKKESIETEKQLISKYQASGDAVNIENGGDTLTHHPDKKERIKKITEAVIKRYMSMTPEKRKSLGKWGKSNGMFGHNHTDETKKLISKRIKDYYKDHKGWMFGRKLPKEQRDKLSEFAKTRIGSKNPFYGKKHSEETKLKLRKAKLGNQPPNIKKCSIDGVIYESCTKASKILSVNLSTLTHRIRSKSLKYASWRYLNAQRPERECSYDTSVSETGEGL